MSLIKSGHRKLAGPKKNIDLLRSGSFKGVRLRQKIKRPTSLPVSPSAPAFPNSADENDADAGNHSAISSPGSDNFGVIRSSPFDSATYPADSPRDTGVIDLGNLTSKGVSILMFSTRVSGIDFPLKDSSPVLSKSRTEKFHKLFKSVPDHEYPIDYFSCAYIGDILLQGNLYVSQNWFCFYSRIRGRGRLLEIPMDNVISITREKTAIIFPNAIGLQTKKEKFAFGSFISRDSTYKFLVSIWKKSQELKVQVSETIGGASNFRDPDSSRLVSGRHRSQVTSDPDSPDNMENLNNNITSLSHSNSKTDSTDQSDISVCLECGSVDVSDTNEAGSKIVSDNTNSSPSLAVCQNKNHVHRHSSKEKKITHARRKGLEGKRLQFPYSVMHCINREKTIEALQKSAIKLQKIPRTNLLLAVCTILVLFLFLSAIGLTYKILDLEAKLETQGLWTTSTQQTYRDRVYGNMVNLQSSVHHSTAQHMHTVLQANIRILEEINVNLKNLHEGTKSKTIESCDKDEG